MVPVLSQRFGIPTLQLASRVLCIRTFATGANISRPALSLEKALAEPDLLVLDVTSEMEFNEGHHPSAMNIPMQEIPEKIGELGNDKTRPVLVYCKKGVRSGMVTNALMQNGFINAFATTNKDVAKMLTDKFGQVTQ